MDDVEASISLWSGPDCETAYYFAVGPRPGALEPAVTAAMLLHPFGVLAPEPVPFGWSGGAAPDDQRLWGRVDTSTLGTALAPTATFTDIVICAFGNDDDCTWSEIESIEIAVTVDRLPSERTDGRPHPSLASASTGRPLCTWRDVPSTIPPVYAATD
ncbi:MAG: hypothetical protein H6736_19385 [Alphaproteobacteria bacterium]|nr:hypothetical protein [Alphaproteobacteria bacterium]MCB9693976.1 hypothetical protein [Alphaproteobacteria bacterium]